MTDDQEHGQAVPDAPRCRHCLFPMDAELTALEGWIVHPSCDPPRARPRLGEVVWTAPPRKTYPRR